jgi:hypothetical protein
MFEHFLRFEASSKKVENSWDDVKLQWRTTRVRDEGELLR